jgi:hypothetical protein
MMIYESAKLLFIAGFRPSQNIFNECGSFLNIKCSTSGALLSQTPEYSLSL